MLDLPYLQRLEEYLTNNDCQFEFDNGNEEKRLEILDFLEKLMEVGEHADALATQLIFKGGLGALAQGTTPEE